MEEIPRRIPNEQCRDEALALLGICQGPRYDDAGVLQREPGSGHEVFGGIAPFCSQGAPEDLYPAQMQWPFAKQNDPQITGGKRIREPRPPRRFSLRRDIDWIGLLEPSCPQTAVARGFDAEAS